jgi:toxin FitB
MYLLDTNAISEFRRQRPHGAVLAWLETVAQSDLSVCAYSIGEIQFGIENTRLTNVEKADDLELWLARIIATYSTLSLDVRILRCWAKLIKKKTDDRREDAFIAATAIIHNLTVVTRNTKDFESFNVPLLNPFEYKPS